MVPGLFSLHPGGRKKLVEQVRNAGKVIDTADTMWYSSFILREETCQVDELAWRPKPGFGVKLAVVFEYIAS